MKFMVPVLLAVLAAPLAQAEEPYGESIDVRVVNVEAVVTDREGNRVRGLAAGDFRLLVDGREVPVDYFTEVAEGVALPIPPSGATDPESSTVSAPAPAGPVGRSYLVFIDDSFSIAAQRDLVLWQIERDLGRLGPEDRMAVVEFDGNFLHRLADWTGDRAVLAAAFAEARQRPAGGLLFLAERRSSLGRGRIGSGLFQDGNVDRLDLERLLDAEQTLDMTPRQYSQLVRVVDAAAAALRGFSLPSGRKSMLLLSGGWPIKYPTYGLVQEANRLGYTLYPVDVPGVDVAFTPGDVTLEAPAAQAGIMTSEWELAAHDTLHSLAAETGGRAAINSARLSAMKRAEEDTRSYYWLGFSPAWKADDQHHGIELEVRRPGLAVRARSGFSDLSPATLAHMETENLLLFGVPEGSLAAARLDVEMGEPRKAGWQSIELPVTLVFPAGALTAGQETDLVLSVGALDKYGARSDLPQVHIKVSLPEGTEADTPVRSQVTLKLRKTQQRLVFQVRDPETGSSLAGEVSFQPGK